MMDNYGFYTGKSFDAYEFFGCHTDENGAVFRVFAPAAVRISVIGEFNGWQDTPMNKIGDGNFWAVYIEGVKPGRCTNIKFISRTAAVWTTVTHTDMVWSYALLRLRL